MIPINKKEALLLKPEGIHRGLIKYVILALFPIIFLNYLLLNAGDKAADRNAAFQPGEKLTYKGKWGIIPTGELTLEVLPIDTVNGVQAYHFVMITKTNDEGDRIYKIRERQDSYVDTGVTHSIFYKKKTESEHPRDESINFDWIKLEAVYTNFAETRPPIRIMPGTFDPLALFYAIRSQNLKENSEIYIPLTDGKHNIEIRIMVGKRDVTEIAGKMYNTLEITPYMEMLDKQDKEVRKSERAQLKIWVTDDEKKIPIKIRSKVGIISFDFDLVSGPS
ncbi:MAG: DUF3108 domain-containing protein [Deltaproteobacteria bacterium]|nr:DUF3108 domain-containing protein [Deltaproteobacteria bacterium]